jgi:Ca2+-binding RTX toxin-like protein
MTINIPTDGNDTMQGGDGNDTMNGHNGNDTMQGGNGDDMLMGDAGNDIMGGGEGLDNIQGGDGNDTMNGHNGNDTMQGGNGDDMLMGDAGNDIMGGGDGIDNMQGGEGHDNMNGHNGNDILVGGNGNDILVGGTGYDRLTGGAGCDVFTFSSDGVKFGSANLGVDKITDFYSGADKIALSKSTFSALNSYVGNGFNVRSDFAIVSSDAAAACSSAKIVYNYRSGALIYNENGSGYGLGNGGVFATVNTNSCITSQSFTIIH